MDSLDVSPNRYLVTKGKSRQPLAFTRKCGWRVLKRQRKGNKESECVRAPVAKNFHLPFRSINIFAIFAGYYENNFLANAALT